LASERAFEISFHKKNALKSLFPAYPNQTSELLAKPVRLSEYIGEASRLLDKAKKGVR
jgi:hypothetical protein